jgi:hypothetical protein
MEEVVIDGRLILKRVLEKNVLELVDLIHMTQDRDSWRALVNTVLILLVP